MRLRLVPVDLSVKIEDASPMDVAYTIAIAWQSAMMLIREKQPHLPTGEFSFSQLALLDICPLAYRYKYLERRPEVIETEQMFLGSRVHEALSWLYRPRASPESQAELIAWFSARLTETLPPAVAKKQANDLHQRGVEMLRLYFATVFRFEVSKTIDVESRFAIEVGSQLFFVGRIDRVALAPSGTFEAIDYKSSARLITSRPRIPDLLQLAAYGVATILKQQLTSVIARRLVIPTGDNEKLFVQRVDLGHIRLAVRRWIGRLSYMTDFHPRAGRHCASCQFNPICPAAAVPTSPKAFPAGPPNLSLSI